MTGDGHIRLLPVHVANKIAAGEVVERPSSVLKELMENSIDAEATRIDVTVTAGGRKLVSVRDNGCGMKREDALLSLERQATSKIRDVDDIERIATLGFRGEAIPSIASVSRFTMITRRADDDAGTQLQVNAGTLAEVRSCGAPPGTTIEVRDLFCNVPARRKFLRAYTTEEIHIKNVFEVCALAHPDVAFSLMIDGREVHRFAANATINERIREVFGNDFAECLIPIDYTATGPSGAEVSVKGFIERPDNARQLRHDQYIFINSRPASAPAIAFVLREAYPHRRGDNRPAVVLFIELPPDGVDVNVHPTKREVRFRHPVDVRDVLNDALADAMRRGESEKIAASEIVKEPPPPEPPKPALPNSFQWQEVILNPKPFSSVPRDLPLGFGNSSYELRKPTPPPSPALKPLKESTPSPVVEPSSPPPPPETKRGPWKWFRFLAQTEAGYILLETDEGIVTVSPRAARERIAYEALIHTAQPLSQPLLIPEMVQLPGAVSTRIKTFQEALTNLGFTLEPFGRDMWKVDAVPQIVGEMRAADVLLSIANDIAEGGMKRGKDRWREELVARAVAKAHAGMKWEMTPEGATQLVNELLACRLPYVDPRSRAVMFLTSNRELDRRFA